MRQIDFMRAHNNRCIKNITACVTQSLKTIELDESVCTLLLTNVKIFLQNDKKSIFEGSGGWAQNGSKTWSKCHFLLLYRRKSGQKVGKTQSFIRGFSIFQKTRKSDFFTEKTDFWLRVLIFVTLGGAHQVIETVNDNRNQTRAKRSLKSDRRGVVGPHKSREVGPAFCSTNTCCSRKSLYIFLYNYRNLCVLYSYKNTTSNATLQKRNVVVTKWIVTEATSSSNKQSE